MAESKECGFCDAKTNPRKSLADQDWIAIQLHATDSSGTTLSFNGRACPKHRDALLKKAHEFYMRER